MAKSKSNSEEKPTNNSQRQTKSESSKKATGQGKAKSNQAVKRKKSKGTFYNLSGELSISWSPANIDADGPVRSPDLVVDEKKNAFGKASLDVDFNGEERLIVLDSEQVELLLKLIGVTDING